MQVEVRIGKAHESRITGRGDEGERDLGRWRAGCACGWQGPAYPTYEDAEIAYSSHLHNSPVTDADPGRYLIALHKWSAEGPQLLWRPVHLR